MLLRPRHFFQVSFSWEIGGASENFPGNFPDRALKNPASRERAGFPGTIQGGSPRRPGKDDPGLRIARAEGGVKRFRAIGKSYRVLGGDRGRLRRDWEFSSGRGVGFWYNRGMKKPDLSPERPGRYG